MGLVEQRAAVQFPINRNCFRDLTVSVGVAVIPDHGRELEAAIHAADSALYQATKENGRNRVIVASSKKI